MIDLRSDTVTKPTAGMLEAMAGAPLGDDVLGDDPTVLKLEAQIAGMLGKEAAVFMPSGTMANQIAIRSHTEPGDEILVERDAHIYYYEGGAPAALSGVMCRLVSNEGERPSKRAGTFTGGAVEQALRPVNVHFAPTKLICIENTHNRGGGSIWPLEQVGEVSAVARARKIPMHLDGARLCNAAVASGVSEREYGGHFDSISLCFSKGLGAPVGSALVGSYHFIHRARRFRKQFGGGMRQSGLLAAAAIYALEHHRDRLADDHAHARILGEAISNIAGLEIDLETVQTNIVVFEARDLPAEQLTEKLRGYDIHMLAVGPQAVRAVTHLNVSGEEITKVSEILAQVMRNHPA